MSTSTASRSSRDNGIRNPPPSRVACHETGAWMHAFASELFPICRSITGRGLRATLRRIQREIPITIHEVPSGTPVLDWTVPDEWNIHDAWICNARGDRIVDFRANNLHVVNYSTPVRARLPLTELRPHLHTIPEHPDWIPYRTSYYKRTWGFCLSQRQLEQLNETEYDVCIDATLSPGALSYGELLLRGASEDEFLLSIHCCHPSLANDNLSGMAVAVALAKSLQARGTLAHSYRFLFVPGTIGAISWLARNENQVSRIKAGLVLTCVGDARQITYKKSRRSDAVIDQIVPRVLRESNTSHRVIDFFPYGYDERQYCSLGFNLPMGCFMRSRHNTFPEYHTSADNLEFIKAASLEESLHALWRVIEHMEEHLDSWLPAPSETRGGQSQPTNHGRRFLNLKPKGEPQLGKYGIYEALEGDVTPALWMLNFSDGAHSLEEIAARSVLPFDKLVRAADILCTRGLLKEVEP